MKIIAKLTETNNKVINLTTLVVIAFISTTLVAVLINVILTGAKL